jgi:hypothetical protein
VLVGAAPGEEPGDARLLAAWLDARAARPAAVRAAASPAEVTIVRTRRSSPGVTASRPPGDADVDRFLRLDVPGVEIQLGL